MTEIKLVAFYKDWLKLRIEFKSTKEALEAVKKNGYALQYVTSCFFKDVIQEQPKRILTKQEIAKLTGLNPDSFEIEQ